jgi:hypothetical protein
MTNIMASLLVDLHPSKFKLTVYHDGNFVFIPSTVSGYCLLQMFLKIVVGGSTSLQRDAAYDRRISTFDIAFHGL